MTQALFWLFPAAATAIEDIWYYTLETWDAAQADAYVDGIFDFLEHLGTQKALWRPVDERLFPSVFRAKYKAHVVFFQLRGEGEVRVLAILHEKMDVPAHLKDAVQETRRT